MTDRQIGREIQRDGETEKERHTEILGEINRETHTWIEKEIDSQRDR
jgi:hypothetical protein